MKTCPPRPPPGTASDRPPCHLPNRRYGHVHQPGRLLADYDTIMNPAMRGHSTAAHSAPVLSPPETQVAQATIKRILIHPLVAALSTELHLGIILKTAAEPGADDRGRPVQRRPMEDGLFPRLMLKIPSAPGPMSAAFCLALCRCCCVARPATIASPLPGQALWLGPRLCAMTRKL